MPTYWSSACYYMRDLKSCTEQSNRVRQLEPELLQPWTFHDTRLSVAGVPVIHPHPPSGQVCSLTRFTDLVDIRTRRGFLPLSR